MSMILPTPPRTTHKDKENQPPTPVTPSHPPRRKPRIAWSHENLHHAYTTQIRVPPSSISAKVPRKSILKKPSMPLMPQNIAPARSAREVTPEPVDPLHHPLYLNSPVSTLVASFVPENEGKFSLSDLMEAYSLLSGRVKTKARAMLDTLGPIPALDPLKEHRDVLFQVFRRDIGRAFIDPQTSTPVSLNDSPLSTPTSTGSVKKHGFSEIEVKYARDLGNLCHAALRCFSNMAVVPVLYSIFTEEQLSDILTDILAIPLAASLPTPNARKTCQISLFALQSQILPSDVLRPAVDRITYAIRRGIDGELGRDGKQSSYTDGLKAIGNLVSRWPELFLKPFADLIPSVLVNLLSQNNTLRVEAAHSLLKYSFTLVNYMAIVPSDVLTDLADYALTFITNQPENKKNVRDVSSISQCFTICFNTETPVHTAYSPIWAHSVIACLIILSGKEALIQPKVIKPIMHHLQTGMTHKKLGARAAGGLVWRTFVWAAVQLDKTEAPQEKKESAWRFVRQVVDAGVGIAIVEACLGAPQIRSKRLSEALKVVHAMIKKGARTCEEGVNVLAQLMSRIPEDIDSSFTSHSWTEETLLVDSLFDGTLLRSDWKQLTGTVRAIVNKNSVVSGISPLEENEVIQYWDIIFAIWKEAIAKAPLGAYGEPPAPLSNVWQSLLVVQARLHDRSESPDESPFIGQLQDLLIFFLLDPSLDWSLEPDAPSWAPQVLKLGLVSALWAAIKDIFPTNMLNKMAISLISRISAHRYSFEKEEVLCMWASLCAELLLVVASDKITLPWKVSSNDRLTLDVRVYLWRNLCELWIQRGRSHAGVEKVLSIPFLFEHDWVLDEKDLHLWNRAVEAARIAAAGRRLSAGPLLDSIAKELEQYHDQPLFCILLPSLLQHTTQDQPLSKDILTLLQLTNDTLQNTYAADKTGARSSSLTILSEIIGMMKQFEQVALLDILVVLQDGASTWIEDKLEIFTDEEYNEQVIPLYAALLDILAKVPPSADILKQFLRLISSGFNRIPQPALGPLAFKEFWLSSYRSLDFSDHPCPEEIKPLLRSIQEVMCTSGEVLASDLSQGTQTLPLELDDVPMSIVPESIEDIEGCCIVGSFIDLPQTSHEVIDEVPSSTDKQGEMCSIASDDTFKSMALSPSKALSNISKNQLNDGSSSQAIIKTESLDFDTIIEKMSVLATPSQSKSMGKRRKPRISFSNRSNKRRKTARIPAGVEIINVSDDEDTPAEDSIVVAKVPRRKVVEASQSASSTSKHSAVRLPASQTPKFYVEILKKNIKVEEQSVHAVSPCKRKHEDLGSNDDMSKRRSLNEVIVKREEGEDYDNSMFKDNRDTRSDELHTPPHASDISIPSSSIGQISGKYITSPEPPQRRRSEYHDDPPSDDPASSSPLRNFVARRQRHRASTAPTDSPNDIPQRRTARRVASGEYLALEQAHVAITSGASKLGLNELLEATRMANGISMALNNQMARKLSSGPPSPSSITE